MARDDYDSRVQTAPADHDPTMESDLSPESDVPSDSPERGAGPESLGPPGPAGTSDAPGPDAFNPDSSDRDASGPDAFDPDGDRTEDRTDLSATAVEPDTGVDLDSASGIQPVPPEAPGEPASETAVAAVEGGAEEAPEGLWPDGAVDELRQRWDAIQMRFVDDPSAVAADARALVGEAVRSLQETLSRWEQEVQEWATESDDTEELRRVVARYRRRLESIIS